MEGSVEDLGAPDSWEMADLDQTMKRLAVSSKKKMTSNPSSSSFDDSLGTESVAAVATGSAGGVSEDAVNQVDEFLREALQNPRERLSILRIEQDVEKFIRDPSQQQLEFQQLPTSYLRLAAHRVAQHYHLQSMVVSDNNLPDGSGSRIIVHKTPECRFPPIRLAGIPVSSQQGSNNSATKVAIKQRQKRSQTGNNANLHSSKANHAKSVEERKEEYNRARARIFSSENLNGGANGKVEDQLIVHPKLQPCSLGPTRVDERFIVEGSESLYGGSDDPSIGSSRSSRDRAEHEPAGRNRTNNRVAIFRDREVDRKDPDYDRSYDRYMQRFDPGFGFSGGPYTIQPIYSPALNYNTEFPQLGVAHRPQVSMEHQPRHMPQHLGVPWSAASTPGGIGYGPQETMLAPLNINHVGPPSTSAIYLHSPHYPCPRPGMQFINAHEHIHLPFTQAHQHQHETTFGLARPR